MISESHDIMRLLQLAGRLRASDVHISAGSPVRYRVNGALKRLEGEPDLTGEHTLGMARELMNSEQLRLLEAHGQVEFAFADSKLNRFRVSVFRQRGSVNIAVRPIAAHVPVMEELGLPGILAELALRRQGLLLVTGPTGSGKSTSLASVIDFINRTRQYHILTLEDPVEFLHSNKLSIVSQREVGKDTLSFADGLQSAFRQDPDVILVGELRNYETISIAMTAAETGHLVLGTLHTLDAVQTVDRIINVFPSGEQQQVRQRLAAVLLGVMAQRLIPTTDGKGRVAAVEMMLNTPAIANLIRSGKEQQIRSVMQMGQSKGMLTMDMAVGELVQQRLISGEAALEVLAGYGDNL